MQNVYSPHSIRTKYFILRAKHFMNLVISLGWAELWGKVKKADLIGLNVLMKHILFFFKFFSSFSSFNSPLVCCLEY